MINAKILLKNKSDEHLNVFWQYDGKPWLENNITKALINTFESLSSSSKKKFIQTFFGFSSLSEEVTYKFYLQKSPEDKEIKSIKESNRLLFAFSPTGKSWGAEGIDTGNIDLIKDSIKQSLIKNKLVNEDKEIDSIVKDQLEETMSIIENRGGSIPDAWIIILKDNNPIYCIAMENKLYDLNPFQLNNHCTKSLFMKKNSIKYAKYSEILESLSNLKGYLVDDFLRYMYFLNYWEVNNLSQLEGMAEEHIQGFATERCRQLLTEISQKEVSWHRDWMYSYSTDNEFNREVGMEYNSDDDVFRIPLYFGSTQNSAKEMYKMFQESGYTISNDYWYGNSFHFQQKGTRKNISETYYYDKNFDINKYINFWIKNADSLHQMGKSERAKLLKKMLNGGIIPSKDYCKLLKYSNSYNKPLNVCPEFGVFCDWDYEQAQQLDEKGLFSKEIQQSINNVYHLFNI